MSFDLLDRLTEAGHFEALDRELARALGRLADESRADVLLALALSSRAVRLGHVCLDLPAIAGRPILDDQGEPPVDKAGEAIEATVPDLAAWTSRLSESPLVTVLQNGNHGGTTPLVLDAAGRLYLHRYWDHEASLADQILGRLVDEDPEAAAPDEAWVRDLIGRLFPDEGETLETDWQRVATVIAALKRFTVITGGPGTGKTTTVLRVLALQVGLARLRGEPPPRIRLLAPTGKAAARLAESVDGALGRLGDALAPEDRGAIPRDALTIHRALGMRPGPQTRFRHDAERPMPVDLVVVDEASMVDAALMRRLMEALPADARLILLGDEHQLSSVEAGAVLAEICGDPDDASFSRDLARSVQRISGDTLPRHPEGARPARVQDSIVRLRHSYRFGADSGIGQLADAIRAGDADRALSLLDDPALPEVARLQPVSQAGRWQMDTRLKDVVIEGYQPLFDQIASGAGRDDAIRGSTTGLGQQARLAALDVFRVLCPLRRGPSGVESLNRAIEEVFQDVGELRLGDRFYVGRPILIRRNDYALRLFNGDVGLILPSEHPQGAGDPRRVAVFPDNRADSPDGVREVSTARLPAHETVFAMSIHKAQGSELDRVLVVLPERLSRILSRELLYTAVTRARSRVIIHGSEASIRHAISTRVQRASGLGDRLRRQL